MSKISKIELILENLEVIIIDSEDIGGIDIVDIKTRIQRIACNSINKYKYSDTVAIEIHKSANKLFNYFKIEGAEEYIFDRLTHNSDICTIEVHYENEDKIDLISVDYDEQRGNNINQKSYIDERGNLCLVISKDKNIEDYFDIDNDNK